jgi:cysteinyl-tRNA synthetase
MLRDFIFVRNSDNPSVLNPLTNQNILEMEGEKRVQKGVKRKASDWILWKPVKNGITWSSPWGDGRPAWNIECTAMIHKILGETITIHGGGIDLITPHHACSHHQSIGVSNHDYLAEIWMHNGHVMVDGKKMSKSDNNFLYLKDILKTYSGEIVRLMFLKTDYRQPLNWTTDSLEEAKNILFSWRRKIKNVSVGNVVINHLDKFDTVSWIKNVNNASPEDIKATLIYFNFYKTFDEQYVNELINSRNFYRKNKNYAEADRIRNILQKDGIQVNDLTDTTEWF